MNSKVSNFVVYMAYVSFGQFFGNFLFLARACYLDQAIFLKAVPDYVLLGKSSRVHLRGSRRSLHAAESIQTAFPSLAPGDVDPQPPTAFFVFPGYNEPESVPLNEADRRSSKNTETVQTSASIIDSLPAFVFGFATSIVLCTSYALVSEMHDRCKYSLEELSETDTTPTAKRHLMNNLEASTGRSLAGSSKVPVGGNATILLSAMDCAGPYPQSSCLYQKGADGVLYPVILVSVECPSQSIVRKHSPKYPEHLYEDRSISPVSSMTSSVAMENTKSGYKIVELSSYHRVSHDTKLLSLIDLGNMTAIVTSSSSESCSTASTRAGGSLVSSDAFKNSNRAKLSVADFDACVKSTSSVIEHDTYLDVDAPFSEEGDSGWTSSAGKSDSSSDVSIGTYLKSVCSVKSQSSARSLQTKQSSVLLGETLATTPEKIMHQESREDENSLELSVDGSSGFNESRVEPTLSYEWSDANITAEPMDKNGQIRALYTPVAVLVTELGNEAAESEIEKGTSDNTSEDQAILPEEIADCGGHDSHIVGSYRVTCPDLGHFLEKSRLQNEGHPEVGSIAAIKSQSQRDVSVRSATDSATSSSIRSLKLVPLDKTSGLGIVVNASCPVSNLVVVAVEDNSSVADQSFAGDIILAVNDMDSAGWGDQIRLSCQDEIDELVDHLCVRQQSSTVNLTLVGFESDGSEAGSTSTQDSFQDYTTTGCTFCVQSIEGNDF